LVHVGTAHQHQVADCQEIHAPVPSLRDARQLSELISCCRLAMLLGWSAPS